MAQRIALLQIAEAFITLQSAATWFTIQVTKQITSTKMRQNAAAACLIFLFLVTVLSAQAPMDVLGLRFILVRSETEANSVLAQLESGARFDDLARKYSIDTSAGAGGYLGTFTLSELRPELRSALDGVNPGQHSRAARIGRDFGILQLLTNEEIIALELKQWMDRGSDPKSPAIQRLWILAISSNDARLIQKFVDARADVNATFGDGSTPLMGAAQSDQLEIVRALLAAGAAVNTSTGDGTTALLLAAQAGRTAIVRALIGAGAAVNARNHDGGTALIDASFGGHVETVRLLLESGADPNLTLKDGSTALMAASGKGHNDVVRSLLQNGAQVNAGLDTGGTALMEAAYAGRVETVRTLLAAGADPKPADPDGLTALMRAALGGHTEVVQALLEAGAPVAPKDKRGWSALTYARASANSATVRMVLAKAADISAADRSLALGGTFVNEYYSSNDPTLLESASTEFQKVLAAQPQNPDALEWMGAVEFLRWDKPPALEQFRKSNSLLKRSADLSPNDPDRHYWVAAINSIFVTAGRASSVAETAAILDDGIQHAKQAIQLDPQFADAMDHMSVLYRRKSELIASERDQLVRLADAAHQDAVRTRARLGNRPSRFNDQFSRPALPPPPAL
jgi:ankyrin repeat protein